MRILRPISGDGVGGIPTIVFPQISDEAATPSESIWTVTGTATKSATHYVVVNGRRSLDFQNYSFNVVAGDTPTIIAAKMADAVNSVLSSPVTASSALGVVTFTTKWSGSTSTQVQILVDNQGNDAGLTYVESDFIDGAGTVDLADSLEQFGNDWYTIVLNPYGSDNLILLALEQ